MKKFWKSLVCAVLSVAMVFALAACGGGYEAKAVKIVDAELEQFGIAVQKDVSTNDTLLNMINTVIDEWSVDESDGSTKMEKLVNYYNSVYWDEEVEAPFTLHLEGKSGATAKIVMATEPGFAPFEFLGENNQIVGLDVALMGEVAYRLNSKLEIKEMAFSSLTATAFSQADVIAAGMTITSERQAAMDFSKPYFESTQYIICAEDADYNEVKDLAGLAIGVQEGTTGDYLISDAIDLEDGDLYNSGSTVKRYENAPVAFEDLKKGTIKAIVIDELPAKALVERSK